MGQSEPSLTGSACSRVVLPSSFLQRSGSCSEPAEDGPQAHRTWERSPGPRHVCACELRSPGPRPSSILAHSSRSSKLHSIGEIALERQTLPYPRSWPRFCHEERAVSPSPFPARNKEEFIPSQSLIRPGPTGPPRPSFSSANKGVVPFQNRVVRVPAGRSRTCPAPKSVGRGGILPEAGLWALLPWGLLLVSTSSLCSRWKLHIERVPVDDVAAWLRACPSEFGSSAVWF